MTQPPRPRPTPLMLIWTPSKAGQQASSSLPWMRSSPEHSSLSLCWVWKWLNTHPGLSLMVCTVFLPLRRQQGRHGDLHPIEWGVQQQKGFRGSSWDPEGRGMEKQHELCNVGVHSTFAPSSPAGPNALTRVPSGKQTGFHLGCPPEALRPCRPCLCPGKGMPEPPAHITGYPVTGKSAQPPAPPGQDQAWRFLRPPMGLCK